MEQNREFLVLAGASVDDIFVIVLFTAFTGLAQGKSISAVNFINIPVSIMLGIGVGIIIGYLLSKFFTLFHMRDTVKVIILLCVAFLLVTLEDLLTTAITFSSLLSIMFIGITLQRYKGPVAKRLSIKYNKLWVLAEILLFVLVGATVNTQYIMKSGFSAVLLLFGALAFRIIGVFMCLLCTRLSMKERIFCMLAYTPKATVQAAIGGIPLAMGLSCGNKVLSVAVLAILITAPLGAFLIEFSYKSLLQKAE